jgi:uncharacterized protein
VAKKSRDEKAGWGDTCYLLIGIAIVIVIVVLAAASVLFTKGNEQAAGPSWSVDGSGLLSFSHRELAGPRADPVADTANETVEKIRYFSLDTTVYGWLRIPKGVESPPVVIVLPAATVTKEGDSAMAVALSSWGYASLTLDERGNGGETGGSSPMDIRTGYAVYRNGGLPSQYAQIYDTLLGYDYIRSRPDLDGGNVTVLGESMGGRFAIVTAAIEPGLKGALVVSSGPYGIDAGNNTDATRFVRSIEPATYLEKIPPRKLVVFHFTNDSIIPIESGRALYGIAGQPKAWYQYNGSVHGLYSNIYAPDLHSELKTIFGR